MSQETDLFRYSLGVEQVVYLFVYSFDCCRYRFDNASESNRFEFMAHDTELKTYKQVRNRIF